MADAKQGGGCGRRLLMVLLLAAALGLAYFILTYESTPSDAPLAEREVPAEPGVVRLATWNMLNLGKSKSDEELAVIARQVTTFDLVAIQEVNTGPDGAEAVARLAAQLGRMGARWDFVVSESTSGDGSERYAFLWKEGRVRLVGQPWLEASLARAIDREPFLGRFAEPASGRQLLVASFHAVPTSKNPASENRLLARLHEAYPDDHLLVLGDFNQPERHTAFDALKRAGFAPVIAGQKTSIKMRRKDGEHLANEYDNIFIETGPLRTIDAGVVDFTGEFRTLRDARKISDHLPVFVTFTWR